MSDAQYYFGSTDGGDRTGLNDPVVTEFSRDHETGYFVVREAIQNSLDAVRDGTKPVRVEIEHYKEEISTVPDYITLQNYLRLCAESYPNHEETCDYFQNAVKLLNGSSINWLRISDYNTIGLNEKRRADLLTNVGLSNKEIGKGGSYGLGKGALWAASQLRTIFIYSISREDGRQEQMFQGKCRIVSFKQDEDWRQGNGTYGLKGQLPINDPDSIPGFFKSCRDGCGTDIWIPAYNVGSDGDWKSIMITAVLENYWLAVVKGTLEVVIGSDKIVANNVERYFEEQISRNQNSPDKLKRVQHAFACYHTYQAACNTGTEADRSTARLLNIEDPDLGDVKIYVSVGSNESGKQTESVVFMRRNYMKIFQKSYSIPYSYTAVCIVDGIVGNEFLRRCENQRHEQWSYENFKNSPGDGGLLRKYKPTEVRDVLRRMNRSVRDALKNLHSDRSSDDVDIPFLNELIEFDASPRESHLATGSTSAIDKTKEGVSRIVNNPGTRGATGRVWSKDTKVVPAARSQDGFVEVLPSTQKPKRSGRAPASPESGGPLTSNDLAAIQLIDARIVRSTIHSQEWQLVASSQVSVTVDLAIYTVGELAGDEERVMFSRIETEAASTYRLEHGYIVAGVQLSANTPLRIVVMTDRPYESGLVFKIRKHA